jgi:NhaP-type Na+/H+ or K+/H+ antiporter
VTIDPYELALTFAGLAALLAAWVTTFTSRRPLSVPIVLVALGAVAFLLPIGLPDADPRPWTEGVERVTEFVVIVSLMGAGLRLDRLFGWRAWASTWRLVGVAMPLTIGAIAVTGSVVVGLAPAAAVLLGAALAPTDPVLASDVQVGEPTLDEEPTPDAEEEVRFALTSEGGLNDALAFPFVYLAILLAGSWDAADLLTWFGWDLVGRIVIGAAVGLVVGKILGTIAFRPPGPLTPLAERPQGFVVIAATLVSYGGAELLSGYGFLAVFVAAVALRNSEHRHELHAELHGFAEQTENLLVAALLVLFGGALVSGVLDGLSWRTGLVSVIAVLLIRPLVGWVSMAGRGLTSAERGVIAFFGIRGFGSVYYLAYALGEADFTGRDELWAILASTVLLSIVVHGFLATPALAMIDRLAERRTRGRPHAAAGPADR